MTAGPIRPGVDWSPLADALARARDSGYVPSFWWRDDDATRHTPALDRLLALSGRFDVPLAIAAVPARTEPSLAERLANECLVTVLVHGHAHRNHAPPGEKKAEFGAHRHPGELEADAAEGLAAATAAGLPLVPVFVPPWNRAAADLVPTLPALGYRGVSAFKDRAARLAAPGLVQVNAHLDPVDWHGGGAMLDRSMLVAALARAVIDRTEGRADRGEAIGLLTHHLAHDEAVWAFCESFVEHVAHRYGMRFLPTRVLFDLDGEGRSGTLRHT